MGWVFRALGDLKSRTGLFCWQHGLPLGVGIDRAKFAGLLQHLDCEVFLIGCWGCIGSVDAAIVYRNWNINYDHSPFSMRSRCNLMIAATSAGWVKGDMCSAPGIKT